MSSSDGTNSIVTDLKLCPWSCIRVADATWLVKALFTDDSYEIIFSDQSNAWHEQLQVSDISKRSKETNPSLEIETPKLLNHIRDGLLGTNSDAMFTLPSPHSSRLTVIMSFRLSGLPFCWKFIASPVPVEVVQKHLTEPLMAMVCELATQRRELYTLLRNKDREIADLKAQGVTVSRKKLETPVFDEAVFQNQAGQSKNAGCLSAFDSDGQQLYRDVMSKSVRNKSVAAATAVQGARPAESCSSSAGSSPVKSSQHQDQSKVKETEEERRVNLAKRLAEEEKKQALKKKKKIKF